MDIQKKILIVEDSFDLRSLFVGAIEKNFPHSIITEVDTLEGAKDALRQAHENKDPYTHMIIDCGFPTEEITERLRGNRNGLELISLIRKGEFGVLHQNTPIAFNSAEHPYDKFAERFGTQKEDAGNTRVFFKGKTVSAEEASHYSDAQLGIIARGILKRDDAPQKLYTEDTVCGATIDWFQQLDNPKPVITKAASTGFLDAIFNILSPLLNRLR